MLEAWVNGARSRVIHEVDAIRGVARIIQTNAAGDNIHVIDPATNKVVGVINDIEVPHGVTSAPDGTRLYFTNESRETVDVVDGSTFAIIARIPLSGRPNNISVSKDGKRVYAGIAQAPGAVDVIDTVTLTRAKSIPVKGAIHNVYVTPDGKYVVSGSIAEPHDHGDRSGDGRRSRGSCRCPSGIRPMDFEKAADGSTSRIFVQLSDYHGIAVVDFKQRKEVSRFETPAIPGETKHTEGLQGAPMHGFAITPDGKLLLATSKVYSTMYAYSLPDLKPVGHVHVGRASGMDHPDPGRQASLRRRRPAITP